MKKRLITYRGHDMSPEWPAKIRAAQRKKTIIRNGVMYQRIPYGQEALWVEVGMDPHPTCGDCGVIPGELHVEYCDTEACPACLTGQWLCCKDAPCHDPFAEELQDIAHLTTTQAHVSTQQGDVPDNQLPLL
jgi:hypothetical protein